MAKTKEIIHLTSQNWYFKRINECNIYSQLSETFLQIVPVLSRAPSQSIRTGINVSLQIIQTSLALLTSHSLRGSCIPSSHIVAKLMPFSHTHIPRCSRISVNCSPVERSDGPKPSFSLAFPVLTNWYSTTSYMDI